MHSRWFGVFVALAAAVVSAVLWTRLPAEVVTHWGTNGEPDGWSARWVAAIAMPALIVGLTALRNVLPRIDPLRSNYERFGDTYWLITNAALLLVAIIHATTLAYSAGFPVKVHRVVAVGLGVLLMTIGNYLGKVRPNWFMGIRTPWTLQSTEVWRRTHQAARWLFVLAGLVVAIGALLTSKPPFLLILLSALIASVGSVLLSYLFWRKEKQP